MPRSQAVLVENNFVRGLVTEASGLNFPENACTETYDCIHDRTGKIKRRKGYEFEFNHSIKELDRTEGVVVTYLWRDVSGDGNLSLVVLQVGEILYFYDGSTTDPLSGHPITDNIDLTDFSPVDAPSPKTQECQFAVGNGKLFVVHPYLDAFAVDYDANTETFTTTQIDLEVRDFEGLDDGLAIDNRPTATMGSISTAHHYNMLNQGWTTTNLNTWDSARTDLPSNCDVMWRFKDSNDAFATSTIANVVQGNSPAPKGHYILNVFDKDRQTASGLTISTVSTGYQRASTVAFFAGRLFYAGINYVGLNSNIYFSQIIERDEQFGKCYQANDPTAEDQFDLLPTDGGVIVIQDAGTILKLVSVPGGLVVLASNGIWIISGSTGIGFTANDYSVTKLSSISALTHTSIVDIAGAPVWWNLEGIYRLAGSGTSFTVESITDSTISTFFKDIPPSEKRNARGFYNPLAGIVQWLYRSTESGSLEEFYEFDRVLNLDVTTSGWYVWTIPDVAVKVHGIVVLENRGGAVSLENVVDNAAELVLDNSSVQVVAWTIGNSIVTPSFKYVVSYDDAGHQFTFAEERNDTEWLDWVIHGLDEDYNSYFISGYKLGGNAINDFQSNYINLYTESGSRYAIQGVWDWANNVGSGRWSQSQTVDTTGNANFDIVNRRRKLRGRGKTLQIKINSDTGYPFTIVGWGIWASATATP